jgi:hypothetical protein
MLDAAGVGLLWLDVQGHEGHVLRGARSLTSLGTPVVLEFYPYILRRSRGMPMLSDVAAKRYTHFIDLGEPRPEGAPETMLNATADLPSFAARYSKHEARHFTDLLLLKMD